MVFKRILSLLIEQKTYLPKIHNLGIVNFVSVLTQAIINKEKLIKERHEAILKAIETELLENQKPNKFSFELPRINELEEVGRLDTGLYNIDFKKLDFLITNYSNNYSRLKDLKIQTIKRSKSCNLNYWSYSLFDKACF